MNKNDFELKDFLAAVRSGELEDEEIIATLRSVSQKERVAYYRAMQRHDVVLPSGMPAVLRDVDMTDIMLSGALPPSVLGALGNASETSDEVDLDEMFALLQSSGSDLLTFTNAIVSAALVEPAVNDGGDEDHLSVDEITSEDKQFVRDWVDRGEPAVNSFRPGEREPVAAA